MKHKMHFNISENKRDYPTLYSYDQLTCDEIFRVSQYYGKKKNIRLYVQTYLNNIIEESSNALDNMRKIQKKLTEQDYVGYLHTKKTHGSAMAHIECFIITKSQIIKPVRWNIASGDGGIYIDNEDGCASTNLNIFSYTTLIPQADVYTCASLSLVYLKQLLQNDAKQLKELTISIPCFSRLSDSKPTYFFVPSPQSLRYSQSTEYNQCLKAMVLEDKPSGFVHKEKTTSFTTLKYQLERTLFRAKKLKLAHIEEEARLLLEQLPAFRQRWKEAFDQMELKRNLMKRQDRNFGLAYTSKRMRKIAIIEQEQGHNPGLTLLHEIIDKKQKESLTDEDLLSSFLNSFSELKFNNAFQLGYFLNKLCKAVDSKILYPWLFKFEHHFALVNHPKKYMDSSFLLDTEERHNLHGYMKGRLQYQCMLDGFSEYEKSDPDVILLWAHALNITSKQDMLNFLQERVDKEIFVPMLIKSLVSNNEFRWSLFFEEKKDLAEFLMEYIREERLISSLPELVIKSDFSYMEKIFSSKNNFYAFIEKYMPIEQALSYLKDDKYFSLLIGDYVRNCVDDSKRSNLVFKELNNPSSILFKNLVKKEPHPRGILEYLYKYCNEQDIEKYLTIHRSFLLEEMMNLGSIYPMNLSGKLHNVALKMNFFSIDNPSILIWYQNAILQCETYEQKKCLSELLVFIPLEQRWAFIEQLFEKNDENFIKKITILKEMKEFFPEKKTETDFKNQQCIENSEKHMNIKELVSGDKGIFESGIKTDLNHSGQIDIGTGKDLDEKPIEKTIVQVVNEDFKLTSLQEN
jgi:hypothetical protein